MNNVKHLILISLLAVLTSCAENNSSSVLGGSGSSDNIYTLSWMAPTQYENGDPLIPDTNLLEYRIYYGSSSSSVTDNYISVNSATTSASTGELSSSIIATYPTVYLAMTSVSSDGVESTLSEVVNFTP